MLEYSITDDITQYHTAFINLFNLLLLIYSSSFEIAGKAYWLHPEVSIPQFEAQSASCTTSARAEVAKRFNKLFLAIAQVALRFKENKSFLRFIALRTEKIYNSVRIIALRTEKNLVACALLRCALSEVEILRCALSD